MQLPGINFINALTILAAIGEIERFPDAKHLVSYSGLYPAVKESGKSRWRGRINKSGRRDLRLQRLWSLRLQRLWSLRLQRLWSLRRALVEAAISASRTHPRTGRRKWSSSSPGSASRRHLLPSPASCRLPSGIS